MKFISVTKCMFFLLMVLPFFPAFGQEIDSTIVPRNALPDSLNNSDIPKIKYTLNPSLRFKPLQLSLSNAKYLDDFLYLELFKNNQDFYSESSMLSLKQISQRNLQRDLRYSFEWLQKDQQKRSLGWVGQALGYVNAAAALGLAAYHIYKYEIKKEKKE